MIQKMFSIVMTFVFVLTTIVGLSVGIVMAKEEEKPEPKIEELPKIVVRGEAISVMRLPARIIETPVSVQVVPAEFISDQGAGRLKDILRYVPGVAPEKTEGFALAYENAFVRGFKQNLYRGGMRTWATDTIDTAIVDRVEVLKGPASVAYGLAEPGGIINVITKRADGVPRRELVFTLGQFKRYKLSLDYGGSLTQDKSQAYRLNIAYNNSKSFRDFVEQESYVIAPAFLWRLGDDTTLDLGIIFKHENRTLDDGVAFSSNGEPVASIDTFLGEPDDEGLKINDLMVDLTFQHRFLPWLTLRSRFAIHDFKNNMEAVRRFASTAKDGTVARFYDGSDFTVKERIWTNDLVFKLDGDGISNVLLLGMEMRNRDYDWYFRRDTKNVPAINITNPVYGFGPVSIQGGGTTESKLDWVSFFVQDKASFLKDRLQIMAGVRFDRVDTEVMSRFGDKSDDIAMDFSFQFGMLYKLLPYFYPYATVSSSFLPQRPTTVDASGRTLDPEKGFQTEVGVKLPVFRDRFIATLSLYNIKKENVAISDPANPGFKINAGELGSRGFELQAEGKLLPNWDLLASYAYTNTEVIRSDKLPEGSRFRGVPLHSGSFWLVYSLPKGGQFSGLRLGGGVIAVGERLGDDSGTFDLPGYTTIGLMAVYEKEMTGNRRIRAHLNIENLLNTEYYESSFKNSRVMPGEPFNARLSFGFKF